MASKHRISRVTTRAGDRGKTKLATGRTIGKHEDLIRAIGSVDELNSHIGMLVALVELTHQTTLKNIQQALFDIGAVFALEGQGGHAAPPPIELEHNTDTLNQQLPPLTEFVLPGGGVHAAQAHICRAVCRRAETDLWHVVNGLEDPPAAYLGTAQYLNRLSDFFFVLARTLSAAVEEQWQGPNR